MLWLVIPRVVHAVQLRVQQDQKAHNGIRVSHPAVGWTGVLTWHLQRKGNLKTLETRPLHLRQSQSRPQTDHAGVSVSPCTHMKPGEPGSWLKRSSALALAAIWGVN